jgi:hypothetical protein
MHAVEQYCRRKLFNHTRIPKVRKGTFGELEPRSSQREAKTREWGCPARIRLGPSRLERCATAFLQPARLHHSSPAAPAAPAETHSETLPERPAGTGPD